MSLLPQSLEVRWEKRLEQPFWRLVQLFVERIFRGGGDSDTEGLDVGIGLVLMLLAMPGGFVSVLLFDKYGSLLQWLRGLGNVDTLVIAFPDEYFFIVLSMTVTGAVAVWRWDAIFPDRCDYMNLAHLPVSARTIFVANLVAVLFLVALVAVDVNGASCVLFPMIASFSQGTLPFFVKFGIVHAAGVLLSSVFSFFAVFSVLGLMMAALPPRALKRASIYVRGMVVIGGVAFDQLCDSGTAAEGEGSSTGVDVLPAIVLVRELVPDLAQPCESGDGGVGAALCPRNLLNHVDRGRDVRDWVSAALHADCGNRGGIDGGAGPGFLGPRRDRALSVADSIPERLLSICGKNAVAERIASSGFDRSWRAGAGARFAGSDECVSGGIFVAAGGADAGCAVYPVRCDFPARGRVEDRV